MKRVLFIISSSEVGGAQTWVKEQVNLLNGEGVFYLITNEPGYLNCEGFFKVKYIKKLKASFGLGAFFRVLKFVKEHRIETVVASSANAGLVARLLKFFSNCKIIYVSHGWSCLYSASRFRKGFIFVEKALSYLSDSIICVSRKDLVAAVNEIGINRRKLVLIRNGVSSERINVTSKHRSPDQNALKVLFLGRLCPPKRPCLLSESVASLSNIKLDIVGDGPLYNRIKRSSTVSLKGSVPLFNDFGKYDIFCLISDSEGLPMSALEAAVAGIPLILSNVGGCSELVSDNGILVENNHESIRAALMLMQRDYDSYKAAAVMRRCEFELDRNKPLYKETYGL